MTMDELAVMKGDKCILQLRGVRPFFSDKYDITQHPNYRFLSDDNPRNIFNIEKFLSHKLTFKPDDEYMTYEINLGDEPDDDLFPDDPEDELTEAADDGGLF